MRAVQPRGVCKSIVRAKYRCSVIPPRADEILQIFRHCAIVKIHRRLLDAENAKINRQEFAEVARKRLSLVDIFQLIIDVSRISISLRDATRYFRPLTISTQLSTVLLFLYCTNERGGKWGWRGRPDAAGTSFHGSRGCCARKKKNRAERNERRNNNAAGHLRSRAEIEIRDEGFRAQSADTKRHAEIHAATSARQDTR